MRYEGEYGEPTGVLRPKLEACEQALHAAIVERDSAIVERNYLGAIAQKRADNETACMDRIAELEAECERLREAERLLRWYVEDDLVEGGDAFGGWDDDVREFVEVAALAAPTNRRRGHEPPS